MSNKMTNKKISGIVFFTYILLVNQVNAESSWWEKASNLFSGADQQDISKTLTQSSPLNVDEISGAFKESLQIASENVVSQLGRVDGFNADDAIHIPLPKELQTVKSMLNKVGLASVVDDLELKLNRAAEVATPKAKALFLESVQAMTFEDVQTIYNGPSDSATKYFQAKMSHSLNKEMSPIVESSLSEVGAIQSYDNVISQYKEIPFVPDVKADLTHYVVDQAMEGIFYYIAEQEAAIRNDPAQQTTALLKKVFSNK